MKKNWIKYIVTFVFAMLMRLLPFRAPNIEPLMAIQMPFAKVYGWFSAFVFGVLSIVLYDMVTSGLGVWTFITALAYGLLGISSFAFLKNKSSRSSYVLFAVVGTILYDALTGLTLGPIFFGQSFSSAFFGQIPFTMLHLLGNVSFAIVLSPAIEKWLVKESQVSVVESVPLKA